jgi:hypothetical protein
MRARTILSASSLFAASLAVLLAAAAADPWLGTWRLNEKKSRFAAGATKYTRVTDEPGRGGMTRVTLDGVDAEGQSVRNEWTGRYDGKDYPVTGDPGSDMRSYKRIDATTLEVTIKKGGKTILVGSIVQSADGKHRTVRTKTPDATARDQVSTAVYEKQ